MAGLFNYGVPKGIRTPVAAVKGRSPRPLDDGDGDWWSQAGSNRRPLACHASALPAELWPQYRRRERVTNGCQTVKPKLFDSAALDHPSFVEIRDYMICDRKHCGQPRRFDAEQVNEPGDSMTLGP